MKDPPGAKAGTNNPLNKSLLVLKGRSLLYCECICAVKSFPAYYSNFTTLFYPFFFFQSLSENLGGKSERVSVDQSAAGPSSLRLWKVVKECIKLLWISWMFYLLKCYYNSWLCVKGGCHEKETSVIESHNKIRLTVKFRICVLWMSACM